MKKTFLKDDNGKSLEVDLKKFIDHLNEYHKTGTSLHTQEGCAFTIDDEFRAKINELYPISPPWIFQVIAKIIKTQSIDN